MGDPSVLERRPLGAAAYVARGVGVIHDIGYDLPDLTKDFWHGVSVRAVKKDGATSRVFWRTYVHIGAEFPGL